jgi:hypothetical protein
MVATDVASRGIGMIDHNSPFRFLFLLDMLVFSYLYFLPLTSCENWCSSLLTVPCTCCPGFVRSLPKGNLELELQFAFGTFLVLCLLTSISGVEALAFVTSPNCNSKVFRRTVNAACPGQRISRIMFRVPESDAS